jgi:LPS export ABC transporter protein LptC
MMRGRKNILWLLPLALFLLSPLWRGPAGRWLAPPAYGPAAGGVGGEGPQPVKSFQMTAVLFSQHRAGEEDWQIRLARLSSAVDNEDLLFLQGVEAQFFAEGRRKFLISGDHGRYDSGSRILTLEEDVRVLAEEDGFLVQGESLRYNDASRLISTEQPVRISGENMNLSGAGLVYDMERGSYEVAGRLRVETW